MEFSWHVARYSDESWSNTILKWKPYLGTTYRGRPLMRWIGDLNRTAWLEMRKTMKIGKNEVDICPKLDR